MKYKAGKMKYDLDTIEVQDEFGIEEESIILSNTAISRFKGVGSVIS